MKTLSGLVMFVLMGFYAQGQTAPKVIAEISASSEKAVKGAPFSAEAVSESVQTLADGNRIVRKWTSKLYRNSEGRFRREGSDVPGSALGAFYGGDSMVTILDPAGGNRFYLDSGARTARVIALPSASVRLNLQAPILIGGTSNDEKVQEELKAAGVTGVTVVTPDKRTAIATGQNAVAVERLAAAAAASGQQMTLAPSASSKYDVRTESLGTQNIEGVDAEGTRTVTTIPAGSIGNERPIEIVYERWYSKELQQIVYSKHSDPRFGDQTYRLTNINRSEPDPSLFEVPTGYRIETEPPAVIYRPGQATKVSVEKAMPVKGASATTVSRP
jgi:hypothetical protein